MRQLRIRDEVENTADNVCLEHQPQVGGLRKQHYTDTGGLDIFGPSRGPIEPTNENDAGARRLCSMFFQNFANEERRSARRGQGRPRRERAASQAPCSVSLVCSQTNKQRLGVKPGVSMQGRYGPLCLPGKQGCKLTMETVTLGVFSWGCLCGGACKMLRGSAHCSVYDSLSSGVRAQAGNSYVEQLVI